MSSSGRKRAFFAGMLVALATSPADFNAQEPAPQAARTPLGVASQPTPTPADQATGSASQPTATGLLDREELTGDWGGLRSGWKDKGVVFNSPLTQFYQGVASGGTETGSEYNGTAQAHLE